MLSLTMVLSSCGDRCESPGQLIWNPNEIEGFKIAKDYPESSFRKLSVTWQQKPPFTMESCR